MAAYNIAKERDGFELGKPLPTGEEKTKATKDTNLQKRGFKISQLGKKEGDASIVFNRDLKDDGVTLFDGLKADEFRKEIRKPGATCTYRFSSFPFKAK